MTDSQQLHTLFQQQHQYATQLLEALKQESDALVNRNFEQLQKSTEEKVSLTQTLEKLAHQQANVLAKHHKTSTAQDLDKFIEEQPDAARKVLSKQRKKLQSLLEECQTLNLVNGQIIAASKQSAEAALAILRGQETQGDLVYGAEGQTLSEKSEKPLLKA